MQDFGISAAGREKGAFHLGNDGFASEDVPLDRVARTDSMARPCEAPGPGVGSGGSVGRNDPELACHVALDVVREDGRGDGGLILLDWRGRLGWAHSTPFMPVGWCVPTATEPVLPF